MVIRMPRKQTCEQMNSDKRSSTGVTNCKNTSRYRIECAKQEIQCEMCSKLEDPGYRAR